MWKDNNNIKAITVKNFRISEDPYVFDLDKNGFPALSRNNVKRINFIIHHDSNYRPLDDNGPDPIRKIIEDKIKKAYGFSNEKDDILKVVEVIDNLNSTHQSSLGPKKGGGGIDETAQNIASMNDFYKRLEKSDPDLVNYVAQKAISSRYTFSFASKYCTYMARALYAGDKEKEDGYCIFDKVMCDILPYYAWVYLGDSNYIRLSHPKAKRKKENTVLQKTLRSPMIVSRIKEVFATKNNGKYEEYRKLIDSIIQRAELLFGREYPKDPFYRISRKDFDHLLWYYFKGGNPKIEKALRLIGDESAILR